MRGNTSAPLVHQHALHALNGARNAQRFLGGQLAHHRAAFGVRLGMGAAWTARRVSLLSREARAQHNRSQLHAHLWRIETDCTTLAG